MAKGTFVDFNQLDYIKKKDASFRIIHDYFIGTDEYIIRFDFKINGNQYSVGLHTTGNQITELKTPNKMPPNMICLNVKTNLQELHIALSELVKDIEQELNNNAQNQS